MVKHSSDSAGSSLTVNIFRTCSRSEGKGFQTSVPVSQRESTAETPVNVIQVSSHTPFLWKLKSTQASEEAEDPGLEGARSLGLGGQGWGRGGWHQDGCRLKTKEAERGPA